MDQEVKDMFTQVLTAIHAQGAKIDMLVTEVAQIKEVITDIRSMMATKDDIAIWQMKKQVG